MQIHKLWVPPFSTKQRTQLCCSHLQQHFFDFQCNVFIHRRCIYYLSTKSFTLCTFLSPLLNSISHIQLTKTKLTTQPNQKLRNQILNFFSLPTRIVTMYGSSFKVFTHFTHAHFIFLHNAVTTLFIMVLGGSGSL